MELYKHLNTYYIEKYGERTLKICIDGNFTCPNRDGSKSSKGCIFCSEKGSGELIKKSNSISEQVKNYLNSYKSKRANKFIVYFQNFTNTYDSIKNLKAKYNASLIDERIVGINIATRPDCIDEKICKLLRSYSKKYDVTIELGLQTANNEIGNFINRCYSTDDFEKAVKLLLKNNINVVAHIMCGLPGENRNKYYDYLNKNKDLQFLYNKELVPEEIKKTVSYINKFNIQGIKIHSTYIVKNTILEELYLNKKYTPLFYEEYMNDLCYIISHINPNLIIHRICGDSPKDILVAPEWNAHKKKILNNIDKWLSTNNLYQGKYF